VSDWIWIIDYGARTEPVRVILADRTPLGSALHTLGYLAINRTGHSWPWWIGISPTTRWNLGSLLYTAGQALLNAADRRTTELAAIPVEGDLAAAFDRHKLIIDWDDPAEDRSYPSVSNPVSSQVSDTPTQEAE